MKKRKYYFNFDIETVDALDAAIETCSIGDAPDLTLGIINSLKLDGYEIVKKVKNNA
jgi:hypothetical protein